MKNIVCVKAVPTLISKVEIIDDGKTLRYESEFLALNESDEYALEAALRLRKSHGGSITAVTVGRARTEEVLRISLAKGVDRACRIDRDEFDPTNISYILAKAISKLTYDLVFTGVESLEDMSSQVGVSLAQRLGIPFAYAATKIELDGSRGRLVVTKELGGGRHQTVGIRLPALICVQTGGERLSYCSVVNLLQAKRKIVERFALADIGISEDVLDRERNARFVEIVKPGRKPQAEILDGRPTEIAKAVLEKIRAAV